MCCRKVSGSLISNIEEHTEIIDVCIEEDLVIKKRVRWEGYTYMVCIQLRRR